MGPGELFTAAAILSVAGWILWRSLLRKKGGCHGCSGCSHGEATGRATDVVRIGASRPDQGDRREPGRGA